MFAILNHVSLTATVYIEGYDVCTLNYICSEGYKYSDVIKYLKEKKPFNVNGVYTACVCTVFVVCCLVPMLF